MILSISNPSNVYPILDGIINQRTRIQSKKEIDPTLELYYKHGTQSTCATCLNAPKVTGRKCPIFDPKTYSTNTRCPSFVNFISRAVVTSLENYDSFSEIEDKKMWARNEGFRTIKEAKECYTALMGKGWEKYPLTVISWELKRIKR